MTSKFGTNKKGHMVQQSLSLLSLPCFDVFCHLLLNRPTKISKLFVSFDKNIVNGDFTNVSALQQITSQNQSKCIYNSAKHIMPIRGLKAITALTKQFWIICCMKYIQIGSREGKKLWWWQFTTNAIFMFRLDAQCNLW